MRSPRQLWISSADRWWEGDHFAKKRLQQWGWGAQDFQTKEVKKGEGALDGGRIEVGDLEDGTVGHRGPRYCGSWPSKLRWANVLHYRRVNSTMQVQNYCFSLSFHYIGPDTITKIVWKNEMSRRAKIKTSKAVKTSWYWDGKTLIMG